jgi:hypothetical protein
LKKSHEEGNTIHITAKPRAMFMLILMLMLMDMDMDMDTRLGHTSNTLVPIK